MSRGGGGGSLEYQSNNQPINPSIHQSINQSISQSINHYLVLIVFFTMPGGVLVFDLPQFDEHGSLQEHKLQQTGEGMWGYWWEVLGWDGGEGRVG